MYIVQSFERTRSSWIRAFVACVSWLNRVCCFPSASKFCGANHCSYARFSTGQSESSIAYMAVSLHKTTKWLHNTVSRLHAPVLGRLQRNGYNAESNAPGALVGWCLDNPMISQHTLKNETETLSGSTAVIIECIAAPLHTPVAELVEGTFQQEEHCLSCSH